VRWDAAANEPTLAAACCAGSRLEADARRDAQVDLGAGVAGITVTADSLLLPLRRLNGPLRAARRRT